MERFSKVNLKPLCQQLARKDPALQRILDTYGYPPLWVRENSFATLVLIILEQQVSLASALAAYQRLQQKLPLITPLHFLQLTEEELRQCSFTRQKRAYATGLAQALAEDRISLQAFEFEADDTIRATLKKLKGIGDWTVDIYLIHALRRLDVFPTGDLALVKAIKEVKDLSPTVSKEELENYSQPWRPYRTIATLMLWHYYIQKRSRLTNLL